MRHTGIIDEGCFSDDRLLPQTPPASHSLQEVLGHAAWMRLPQTVRDRFAVNSHAVDYAGEFEIVRASLLGRIIAWTCRIMGTLVAPYTGNNVPAVVHVGPSSRGVEWRREYLWPNRSPCVVRSTKVIDASGELVEELPAQLRMALDVYEQTGVLHFVSRAYYFELKLPGTPRPLRIALPTWLVPGSTHVEHVDETDGWFRFTMTVTHPLFGEVFYQTGRFRALGG
jgi:hypothetical protein